MVFKKNQVLKYVIYPINIDINKSDGLINYLHIYIIFWLVKQIIIVEYFSDQTK